MFPVFWEERCTFDAKGVHFAVQATAKPLLTLEWLGQEHGRGLLKCTHPLGGGWRAQALGLGNHQVVHFP